MEVKASGINPVDTYLRTGTYFIKANLPYTPGSDVAGAVKSVGAAVTKLKVSFFYHAIIHVSFMFEKKTTTDYVLFILRVFFFLLFVSFFKKERKMKLRECCFSNYINWYHYQVFGAILV